MAYVLAVQDVQAAVLLVNSRCSTTVSASQPPLVSVNLASRRIGSKSSSHELNSRSRRGGRKEGLCAAGPAESKLEVDMSALTPQEQEGGYTPFSFVHFGDQELKHHLQIDVRASEQECFDLWSRPESFLPCFHFVTDCAEMPSESYEGRETAGVTVMYKLGTYPTLELKFIAQCTENEPAEALAFESLEGMPVAGAVEFVASEEEGFTQVHASLVYKMPIELGLFEEPLTVHRNVEYLMNKYLHNFKELVEKK
mmetsp:Transcript_39749/g.55194  ORF Transcript_39749/g.55194 Transcript_39749/m.55194 type:complete len:254 (-) Transcript_39749:109-870(-)